MAEYKKIKDDIYIIELNSDKNYLIYAPLKRKAFSTSDVSLDDIEKSANGEKVQGCEKLISRFDEIVKAEEHECNELSVGMNRNRAVILLTDACNLGCKYCYAQESRSNITLSFKQVKTVVDYILDDSDNIKHFTFIGGGEPTLPWELLSQSIEYIRKNSDYKKTIIGIQTNATLLDESKIGWLKKMRVRVGCSFDVLPAIQNSQRPFKIKEFGTFDVVDETIKKLISRGIIPGIRTTITQENICKMPEMIEFIINHYPQVKKVHFEHVSSPGLNRDNYYDMFIYYFFEAKRIADEKGIYLKNSTTRSLYTLRNRFCSGELCITPSGDIVACHRVSSKNDTLFESFSYGKLLDEGIEINPEKRKQVNNLFQMKCQKKCEDCFAKYHCAGQCCNNKIGYRKEDFIELCDFTQKMILRELEYSLKI